VTRLSPSGTWRRTALALLAMVALASACGDGATQDCVDCPNLALQPACVAAANECDVVPPDDKQTCIDEAFALCA